MADEDEDETMGGMPKAEPSTEGTEPTEETEA
jgi:hypothetical protein